MPSPSVDDRRVEPVLDPDWLERGALMGTVTVEGAGSGPWHSRTARPAPHATAAEVAFAVADDFQGRGIGTRLLEQLAARAGGAGVERFVAEVLAHTGATAGGAPGCWIRGKP